MSDRKFHRPMGTLLIAIALPVSAMAQVQSSPSSTASSLYGSVTTSSPSATVLPLSLDDAIQRGVAHNLQIALANEDKRSASGERLEAINYLLPNITWNAQRNRDQINLEALGFRSSVLATFPPGFLPPGQIANFQPLVTVNVVSAQATLRQTLFDLKSLELYQAAKQEILAVDYSAESSRQDVVQTVANSYLQALANAANVLNAKSLLATNAEILRQATLEHEAGTAAKLDELRARVQYQQQEQVVIAQQNAFEKSKVTLNREIGLPADQPIELTDDTPFAALNAMPLEEALTDAYANRQDYRRLKVKLRSAKYQRDAARFERLPTLSFDGNYGLVGTVGGVYHGVFQAEGALNISLSRLAKFRGDREVADAAVTSTMSQLADLKRKIEAQLRDSLLDVAATEQLVHVGRSNVDLARSSLSDATERFQNGISDDLPVIQAQAAFADAEAQLVNSLYQYNRAKLGLARNLGTIDRQYRAYLGVSNQTTQLRDISNPRAARWTSFEQNTRNGE
ncbi:MAG TPA: TolC family protein [Acidobacteriaceae bacterium]|nr:TolC family protein [Acidobacteriaceae bacterium]